MSYKFAIFFSYFLVVTLVFNFLVRQEQQFSYLAKSFLQGKTYFLEKPGTWIDTAPFENRYYWPLGPLPAVVLMPFVFLFSLFGNFFYQGYLQPSLALGVFYLCYKIAKHYKYSHQDSLLLAFGFMFSSVFLNVVIWPWSWWFAQVITVFLIFLSIYIYLKKRNYIILGLISGLLFLTRLPASLIIAFFVFDILFLSKQSSLKKIKALASLLTPFFVCIILMLIYNFVRFGNVLEQGYQHQIVGTDSLAKAREYGVLSIKHLPGNLYYFLLSTPLPVFKDNVSHVLEFPFIKATPWGMSIFVTSPYLFYLFFLNYKDKFSKIILLTVFIIALPIFLYYGIGFAQYGYRYSLDFLPLLYLLLIRNYIKKYRFLTTKFKILIIISAIANLFFFVTLFI